MILAIRIKGIVGISGKVSESLNRLNLRRKYSAVLLRPLKENLKILKRLENFIAYGDLNAESLKKLVEARAESLNGGKIDVEKVISGLEKKNLKSLGVKPFFRLHPPRGGIESKKHFGVGKGVLGDNKEKINELVERML